MGGGIAGCSTAYALAKRGITVTIIERHEKLALEASGNPIAALYPKLSLLPSMQSTLALLGFNFTLDLLHNLQNNADYFTTCGLIQLAFDAREQARQIALHEQGAHDFFQLLNMQQASEKAGIALKTGGLFLENAGWIKPALLCEALTRSPLITKTLLSNAMYIEQHAGCWRVICAESVIEADNIVLCNANDIVQFSQSAHLNTAVTKVRGQMTFFAQNAASQALKTMICAQHYLSPAVDGVHSIGATYAPHDNNSSISDVDTQANLHALGKISPTIFDHLNLHSIADRVAWRSATIDYMPLAGQLLDETKLRENPPRYNANPASLPWLCGLYINAGHGSKGMITAPLCGEIVASLIANSDLNVSAKLASQLNPSRFLLKEIGLKQLAQSL